MKRAAGREVVNARADRFGCSGCVHKLVGGMGVKSDEEGVTGG